MLKKWSSVVIHRVNRKMDAICKIIRVIITLALIITLLLIVAML